MPLPKLNILVPVKRVIDHSVTPKLNADKTLKITNFAINPFDDIAVEEALKLKKLSDKLATKVNVVTITNNYEKDAKGLKSMLVNSMAKGADGVKILNVNNSKGYDLSPLSIAKLLKNEVAKNEYNLVICGKQAIDDDSGNVGSMLAGLLNWKQANNCCKVERQEEKFRLTKEIDNGEQVVEGELPMVLTTDLRLNVPKYAPLPKIMKVKNKPIKVEEVSIDDIENKEVTINEYMEPPTKKQGKVFTSVDELFAQLKNDKVI